MIKRFVQLDVYSDAHRRSRVRLVDALHHFFSIGLRQVPGKGNGLLIAALTLYRAGA
jgi:hypothetical protein